MKSNRSDRDAVTISAVLVLGSFFMPWFHLFGVEVPGHKIPDWAGSLGQVIRSTTICDVDLTLLVAKVLYLVPILAGITIFRASRGKRPGLETTAAGLISPLFILLLAGRHGIDVLNSLTHGGYVAICAGAYLAYISRDWNFNAPINPARWRAQIDDAGLALERGEIQKAQSILASSLSEARSRGRSYSDFATVYYRLSSVNLKQARFEAAEYCSTRALAILKLDPSCDQGDLAEAERHLERVRRLHAEHSHQTVASIQHTPEGSDLSPVDEDLAILA
jgi:hypothetical protein